jgi:hypothetical protein
VACLWLVVTSGCREAKGESSAMTEYIPAPLSTEGVMLPIELDALIEKLAENNHDHWARQRIEDGWTYGPRRDDTLKTHPDLVPYGDVPESEKEYDRISVVETLKVILSLGYQIVPKRTDV